jgi:cell wall-associated NlpC family hydrolase
MPKLKGMARFPSRRALLAGLALAAAACLAAQSAPPKQVTASPPAKEAAARPDASARSLPLQVVAMARSFLGVPYVSGGMDRSGVDCSGFTFRVFKQALGIEIPRGVWSLYNESRAARYPLHVGDLLFFDTSGRTVPRTPTHVGIYTGGGAFIHAASEGPRTGVISSRLTDAYYHNAFLGAVRVIPWREPGLDLVLVDEHRAERQDDPFPSHEPLTVRIFNAMSGGGPMDLKVLHEGRLVLSRWIKPGSVDPAQVELSPDTGAWTVRVSRIWGGRELARADFTVLE